MRLPDPSQHLAIVGTNGSGKTQAGLWHLSMADIDKRPWVIYNSKRDKSIDAIPHSQPISLDEIPIRPGVFITHPRPDQTEEVENQLWEIWGRENIGVFIDEGHSMGRMNMGYRTLLQQGRSKHNNVITLSQRPVWLDPFVLSEAQFYQVFRLNHKRDRKTVEEFIPANLENRLPDYHSYYYDVGANRMTVLKPVPDIAKIHATFEHRLARVRKTV